MHKVLLIVSSFLLYACGNNTTVTFINKSDQILDSVFFPHSKKSYPLFLKKGEQKKIEIDISTIQPGQDGILGVWIYRNKKILPASFGYDEFGMENEPPGSSIYVFEKGYQNIDRPLKKPTEFDLYLSNKSGLPVDSVKFGEKQLKAALYPYNNGDVTIKLIYDEVEKKPEITLFQNNRKYVIAFEHDWDNWNYNQGMYYLLKEGAVRKTEN